MHVHVQHVVPGKWIQSQRESNDCVEINDSRFGNKSVAWFGFVDSGLLGMDGDVDLGGDGKGWAGPRWVGLGWAVCGTGVERRREGGQVYNECFFLLHIYRHVHTHTHISIYIYICMHVKVYIHVFVHKHIEACEF